MSAKTITAKCFIGLLTSGVFSLVLLGNLFFSCKGELPASRPLEISLLKKAFVQYKELALQNRRFKHQDLIPLIEKRKEVFKTEKLGESVEGRAIFGLSYGKGPTRVMLWSQMHGNESTATMALFDLFNFLEGKSDEFQAIRETVQNQLSLCFIPMLNPDGAEAFQRRNGLEIDLNRDALRLVSPEAILLKSVREEFQPDFGFNLHDQNIYYNVSGTSKPATISVLAPALNVETTINEVRSRAMKVIVGMDRLLQLEIPGQVAKYDDAFEPRAFGDNFQKWGTSTILIESGGYSGDPEKQYIRELNFLILLNSLYEIAKGEYNHYLLERYFEIPDNDSKMMDLIIRNLTLSRDSLEYTVDLGIRLREYEFEDGFFFKGNVEDIGDLSVNYGYREVDAAGMEIVEGKIEEIPMDTMPTFSQAMEMLQRGYLGVRLKNTPENPLYNLPILVLEGKDTIGQGLDLGNNPNFYLRQKSKLVYAIVNGVLLDLENPEMVILNQKIR